MNDKHTPGPWDVERAPQNEGYDRAYVIERNPLPYSPQQGRRLAIVHGHSMENAEANARRIVACVNACEGLDTKMIERFPLNKLGDCLDGGIAYTLEALELKQQRDELASLLQDAVIDMEADQSPSEEREPWLEQARAAIANATKGAGNVKGGA